LEKSSFFNSIAGDRKYQASDFAAFFSSLLTNGVFPNPSTNLQVMSNGDMTVTIKAGKAWVNGYVYINDSDLIMSISVADGTLKRIDRLVVQYSTINREIKIKVKKGTFASSPVAPILQRDADIYELGIADISIVNGATSITQANITDIRLNTTYCGWVNSLIQADTTAIFNQYQAWFTAQSSAYNTQMVENEVAFQTQFDEWFATVQDQLSGDVAGNLANRITTMEGKQATDEQNLNAETAARVAHTAEDATITQKGHVQLSSATNSVSETTAATPKAVKAAMDKASAAETPTGATAKIEQTAYQMVKSNKDVNGTFTQVDYKRKTDGTLSQRSVLSGGTSPQYTTQTVTYYGTDGITVVKTDIFALSYDSDGDLLSEV
jgi:hypothetical protein